MNQKKAFLTCSCLAVLVLCLACTAISVVWALISLTDNFNFPLGDGVGLFNLLVDIVVGVFTIWGLYWAATEFAESAVKPKLKLIVGQGRKRGQAQRMHELDILSQPPFQVSGSYHSAPRKKGNQVISEGHDLQLILDLYLTNTTRRAGRYVGAVVQTISSPSVQSCYYKRFDDTDYKDNIHGEKDRGTGYPTIQVPFEEKFTVYQSPVYAGKLVVLWKTLRLQDRFPQVLKLKYDLHTLDGSSDGELELRIQWSPPA